MLLCIFQYIILGGTYGQFLSLLKTLVEVVVTRFLDLAFARSLN